MLAPFLSGVGIGGGLVVAIGAQAAFVLTQGIRREHHLLVALICAVCDALLIAVGVMGAGRLVAASPQLAEAATMAGALYLLVFGGMSFRAALLGRSSAALGATGRGGVVTRSLVVSLLNPHAYLDAIVLLGGLSTAYAGAARYAFGGGAMVASVLWLLLLALGGQALAPVLSRPEIRRWIDVVVGVVMWVIAVSLLSR